MGVGNRCGVALGDGAVEGKGNGELDGGIIVCACADAGGGCEVSMLVVVVVVVVLLVVAVVVSES